MKHKHAVNQKEHKHADLLRMAADNADQLFRCDTSNRAFIGKWVNIQTVLQNPDYNWRPVKQTKKIKRWLWSDKDGCLLNDLYSEKEVLKFDGDYTTKLLWSETEFEVSDD